MNNYKLINIIGIDGAGKTTLAKALAADLQLRDPSIHYRYCQYFAKLLYPIKKLARLTVMRETDEFKDYGHYNKTKKETSSRFPLLGGMYVIFWLIDYLIQVFCKITVPCLIGQKLIVDRYIYDIAVNLSITINKEINYTKRVIHFFLKFAPCPDLIIFIDLPEEVALSRKEDIQGIEYLRERRIRYIALAETYNFISIDGTRSQEQIMLDVKSMLIPNHE